MKTILLPIIALFTFTACNTAQSPTPSQNEALLSVTSGTQKKKPGAMQKALDNWLETEWTPTVEQDEEIKKVNEDKERPFTLQEYVNKASIYMDTKPQVEESHAQELENLPAIGTKKR